MAYFSVVIAIASLTFAAYSRGDYIKLPPQCVGKKYCNIEPEGYSAHLDDVDRYTKENKYWAGFSAVNNHIDEFEAIIKDDYINCGSIEQVEKPYVISAKLNTSNPEHKYVIQTKYFQQRLKTVTCLNKNSSCFEDLVAQTPNIEAYCDESYTTINLYVFENGAIQQQPFSVPIACTCKVQKKTINI